MSAVKNNVWQELGDEVRKPEDNRLCLAWERGVNLWAEESFRRMNRDESKVRSYTLPPIPDTLEQWEKERPELLQTFKDCLYGEMPPPPDKVELELLSEKVDALQGLAIRREYRVFCRMNNGRSFDFDMLLYVPQSAKEKPVPVFEMLNFKGNQCNTESDEIRPTRGPGQPAGRWHADEDNPQMKTWGDDHITHAVKRGYAFATVCYGEIFPDNLDGFRKSIFRLFYDDADLRPDCEVALQEIQQGRRRKIGAISAWAWGYSRMLDALEQIDLVDASSCAIAGHSRLGKTVLWAGANDSRFKLVCINNSGNGGAALARRNYGETLTMLWMVRPNWFCDKMVRYAGLEEELPVDQHQLIGLIAPRAVCVASSSKDYTADPKGEFLSAYHGSKVWKLYGYDMLPGNGEMPPTEQVIGNDGIRYFVKTGPHSMTDYDFEQYFDFADTLFGKE